MSAIERIKQVQQKELEEKLAFEESEKLRLENEKTLALLFLQELDQIINNDGGILKQLQEIKDKLLTDGQIFIGENQTWSRSVELRWNMRSDSNSNSYNYIRVYGGSEKIDKIFITGMNRVEIPKEQWSDVKVFEDSIANSFLKPGFYKHEESDNSVFDMIRQ